MAEKIKFSMEEIECLLLPERIPTSDIVKLIRLPAKSNIFSELDMDLTPYLKFPLTVIGAPAVQVTGIIGPTQSGKTVYTQAVVADSIYQDPGTLLYVLPDEQSGKRLIKEKIIDMIIETPALRKHISPGDRRNTISKRGIHLDNMSIYPAWSNSLASMSSLPCRRAVLDEVRLMKLQVGDESNAIKLAADRLTTFMEWGLAQLVMVSTPSIKGDLLHQQLSVHGTQVLYWWVPCPVCGTYQILDFFDQVSWDDKLNRVVCRCKTCQSEFKDDDRKMSWNNKGVYAPRKATVYRDGTLDKPIQLTHRMFFRFDSMVSPFRSFTAIWNEYMRTKDKIHDYRNFWQAWLSRFWVNDVSKTTEEGLKKRKSTYISGTVPEGVKLITAGIDTQDPGFNVVIRGWGADRKTWLIDSFFIEAPIHETESDILLSKLRNDVEDRVFVSETGERWKIAACAIDKGGHRTKELSIVLPELQRFLPVLGRNSQAQPYMFMNAVWYVRTAEYLDETEMKCQLESFILPGNVSEDYIQQFINVRKVPTKNRRTGDTIVTWEKIGRCDYRYADVHAFICLDLPNDFGTFRRRLEDPTFKFNPYELDFDRGTGTMIKGRERAHYDDLDEDEYNDDGDNFSVGQLNW